MDIHDRITYVVDVTYRTGFTSLADVFIYQLSNFHMLQTQKLDIVRSIVCKPELESIRNLLCKDKRVCLYVTQWLRDIAKKEISLIIGSKTLRLESSHLSLDKILSFSLSQIDSVHRKRAPFIWLILREYTSDIIKILSATLANSEETLNICDKMVSYQRNLDGFPLLFDQQNFCHNWSLVAIVALCLLSYACSK